MNSPLTWREADIGSEAVLPDTVIPAAPETKDSLAEDSSKTQKKDSSDRSQPPPAQPSKPKLIAVTAIVVILALVAGAFIYSASFRETKTKLR